MVPFLARPRERRKFFLCRSEARFFVICSPGTLMSVHQNTSNQMCDNMATFTRSVKLCFTCSFSDTKNCWKWKEVCLRVCVCGWVGSERVRKNIIFFSIFRQKFFTADELGENRLLSFESFESEFSSKVQSQDLFLIGQRSHDLCLHTVTLCTSVGLSSHSCRNVCIFDKASNTRCIIYTLSSSVVFVKASNTDASYIPFPPL